MSYARVVSTGLVALALLCGAGLAPAEPLFTLADDGRTFLYRTRPGDRPAGVASMFGITPQALPAFLAANNITDPTRVGAGFVYRIPNVAAEALAERTAALTTDNTRLQQALARAETQRRVSMDAANDAEARAVQREDRLARAERLATLWAMTRVLGVLLVLLATAAVAVAVAAVRRQRRAERFARSLSEDLESKRKATLLERQDSTRHILELEARVRSLEVQLGPRVLLGGRHSQ